MEANQEERLRNFCSGFCFGLRVKEKYEKQEQQEQQEAPEAPEAQEAQEALSETSFVCGPSSCCLAVGV